MKRSLLFLLTLSLLLATASPGIALATIALPDGAVLNDPSLTSAKVAQLQKLTAHKDAALGVVKAVGSVQSMSLNKFGRLVKTVTNYTQETNYWCGPASTRQTLGFHKAISGSGTGLPSQSTLAHKIGTNTNGSATSGIVSALNSYDGTFGNVSYVGSNIVGTANPYEAFVNRIGLDLQQPNSSGYSPCIPITLMQTAKIPRYNSHASRHYMSIGGIDDTVSTMKMRSVDPNNNSAYHGVYWDPVGSTTANGLCRACYQADLDGTNLAMCW
jgi:hypothetical protein